jgi:enoyl-CoA hydratase/carnithine racemase
MRRSCGTLLWNVRVVKSANGREANVVTMNTSSVNAQSPEWLSDFEQALDKVQCEQLPVVLTGQDSSPTFCAGLDLIYLFGTDDMGESRKRSDVSLRRCCFVRDEGA